MGIFHLQEEMVGKLYYKSLHQQQEEKDHGHRVRDKVTKFFEGNGLIKPQNTNYFSNTENNEQKSTESYIPIEGASLPISNLSIETQTSSESALEAIDYALDYVAAERSNLGAIQNRLTHTIDNSQ